MPELRLLPADRRAGALRGLLSALVATAEQAEGGGVRYDEGAAREYSEALGLIGGGWWRQVAWAHRQGIPAALGMTTREWVTAFVGGWAKLPVGDRREAALELTSGPDALSQRAAADVLGVDRDTVARDLAAFPPPTVSSEPDGGGIPATPTPLPTGRYRCIVIDPPWPMDKISRNTRPKQGETLDYATMTIEEIATLPIGDLAELGGCHIYLWTTHRFLPDAFRLFDAWGARYQCLMTWVKNVGITPWSWMYDTEHVLFGRIGKLDVVEKGLRLSFSAPVTRHSAKPDVFYTKALAASPGPRLEMFARQPHDGFEPWGDEVTDAR
jgi:N6-adenosine-specific RNA methylase IME4